MLDVFMNILVEDGFVFTEEDQLHIKDNKYYITYDIMSHNSINAKVNTILRSIHGIKLNSHVFPVDIYRYKEMLKSPITSKTKHVIDKSILPVLANLEHYASLFNCRNTNFNVIKIYFEAIQKKIADLFYAKFNLPLVFPENFYEYFESELVASAGSYCSVLRLNNIIYNNFDECLSDILFNKFITFYRDFSNPTLAYSFKNSICESREYDILIDTKTFKPLLYILQNEDLDEYPYSYAVPELLISVIEALKHYGNAVNNNVINLVKRIKTVVAKYLDFIGEDPTEHYQYDLTPEQILMIYRALRKGKIQI